MFETQKKKKTPNIISVVRLMLGALENFSCENAVWTIDIMLQ
jgi:hypothetical protein